MAFKTKLAPALVVLALVPIIAIACGGDSPPTAEPPAPMPEPPAPMPMPEPPPMPPLEPPAPPPPPPVFTLNVATTANGVISADPAECSESCTLQIGNILNFTATPNDGFIFSEWQCQGSCPTSLNEATLNIDLQETTTISPVFVEGRRFSVASSDNGTITSASPAECIERCFLPIGTTISVTAEAGAGYEFGSWECDGECETTTAGESITLTQLVSNTTITPFFVPLPRIVYSAYNGVSKQIYISSIDGSNLMQLTNTGPAIENESPVYLPDSNRILFWRDDVYSMKLDGTDLRNENNNYLLDNSRLIYPTNNGVLLSPDNSLFIDYPGNNSFGITPVISNERIYEDSIRIPANDASISGWSADSRQIAFVDVDDNGFFRIQVVNRDGTNQRVIADGLSSIRNIYWVPNGNEISYATWDESNTIYIVSVDDSSDTRQIPAMCGSHIWSLDGNKIVFHCGGGAIHIANIDGSISQSFTIQSDFGMDGLALVPPPTSSN